jgi:type IV pilus assembly protein PilO
MNLSEWIDGLRKINLNDLDINNIGSWPAAVKTLAALLLLLILLGLGYQFHVSDLGAELDQRHAEEQSLRDGYANKAFLAANLETYVEQMREMETSFGTMLRQLPSDTEVPGLLEDIKLLPEVTQQFYIELPIQITVTGTYHDLATFVSGVASLPRIVTLHDFEVKPLEENVPTKLRMNILAKTYRYNDQGLAKPPAAQGQQK